MKSFKYITLNDMNAVIRSNLHKIPHDVDFVIGVPRSGMICGSVIAEFLNVPLIDVDSFVNGNTPSMGGRKILFREHDKTGKVLVVDDTVNSGIAMRKTKEKLHKAPNFDSFQFIYSCIYVEDFGCDTVDLWLCDLRNLVHSGVQPLYEWNMFNHYPHLMSKMVFDLDGVFCTEEGRPDDRYEEAYEEYIKTVKPLFIPKVPIYCILTYRIKKYYDITKKWLEDNGITCYNLLMADADSWQERNNRISTEQMKGNFFKNHPEFLLFIESDDYQARRIHEISGKQVLCISSNKMYE